MKQDAIITCEQQVPRQLHIRKAAERAQTTGRLPVRKRRFRDARWMIVADNQNGHIAIAQHVPSKARQSAHPALPARGLPECDET